jgi:hypothetical protein
VRSAFLLAAALALTLGCDRGAAQTPDDGKNKDATAGAVESAPLEKGESEKKKWRPARKHPPAAKGGTEKPAQVQETAGTGDRGKKESQPASKEGDLKNGKGPVAKGEPEKKSWRRAQKEGAAKKGDSEKKKEPETSPEKVMPPS